MRAILPAALGALAIFALSATSAGAQGGEQAALRIAYVNSQTIIEQAPGRAEAEAQFEREMQVFRDEIKRMGDSLSTMVAEYQRQEASLSASARLNRQAQIREREEQYQKRVQELEQRAAVREQELIRPLMQWIQQAIDTVRAREGYAMVFDAAGTGGVLVSADRSLDITDRVVEQLRRSGPPPTASNRPATPAAGRQPQQQQPRPGPQAAPAGVTRPPARNP